MHCPIKDKQSTSQAATKKKAAVIPQNLQTKTDALQHAMPISKCYDHTIPRKYVVSLFQLADRGFHAHHKASHI